MPFHHVNVFGRGVAVASRGSGAVHRDPGNGLPGRWAGRDRFVVLETGFGLGLNFLATWRAWRERHTDMAMATATAKRPLPTAIMPPVSKTCGA